MIEYMEIEPQHKEDILNASKNFKSSSYIITLDNTIKMLKIYSASSQTKVPLIISGESGMGKTHLLDFLSTKMLGDILRCITIDAGFT